MNLKNNKSFEENMSKKYSNLLNLKQYNKPIQRKLFDTQWLDESLPQEKSFGKSYGFGVIGKQDQYLNYFGISQTAMEEITTASNNMHKIFLQATQKILKNDHLLQKFCFPKQIWAKIRASWENTEPKNIHGRFDWSVSDRGMKIYEYNADTSSLLMECSYIQGKWCDTVGIKEGKDSGKQSFNVLVQTWKKVQGNLIHIFTDNKDQQEEYHALFMKKAIQKSGKRSKVITDLSVLTIQENGNVCDKDGEQIKKAWKTWSWETILKEYMMDKIQKDQIENTQGSKQFNCQKIKLFQVMLNPKITVYEPLWTVITTNKTILPLIYEMFPKNKYLLNTSFQITQDLVKSGFIKKPVSGRGGQSMELLDAKGNLIEKSEGQFGQEKYIYQQLFLLPKIGNQIVQFNTVMVNGQFAGAALRTDSTYIIKYQSIVKALRILPDEEILK